jgi:hypothetical protein
MMYVEEAEKVKTKAVPLRHADGKGERNITLTQVGTKWR